MAPRINIPPITRVLLASLISLTILNATIKYREWAHLEDLVTRQRNHHQPFLIIVPRESYKFPWTLITSTYVEQNIFGLLITGVTLFYGGRYLERAWSSAEYTKVMLLISIVPNIVGYIIYYTLYTLTRQIGFGTTGISGGIAIQAAFLVAFKQLVPEHTVTVARGLIKMRVKHFPAVFLLANTISGVAFGTETAMLLSWLGFYLAWIYLRFYRISPSMSSATTGEGSVIRGDASDTFAFAYFFPDAIQPPIAKVADILYDALVALKVCTPFSAEDVDAGNEQAMARGEGGLPNLLNPSGRSGRAGGRREEAERRRALALRALDQRLNAATIRPPAIAHSGPSPLGETNYEPDESRKDTPAPASAAAQSATDNGAAQDGGKTEADPVD